MELGEICSEFGAQRCRAFSGPGVCAAQGVTAGHRAPRRRGGGRALGCRPEAARCGVGAVEASQTRAGAEAQGLFWESAEAGVDEGGEDLRTPQRRRDAGELKVAGDRG